MTEEETAIVAAQEAAKKVEAEAAAKEAAEKEEALKNQTPEQKQQAYFKRKAEKAEKLEEEAKQMKEELAMFKQSGNDDVDAKIQKAVADSLIETKVFEFIGKYPDLEEDREKILKYARSPERRGTPLEDIIAGAVGFEKALKLGAKMKTKLEEDANLSHFGGNDTRTEAEKSETEKKTADYTAQFEKLPFIQSAKEALKI